MLHTHRGLGKGSKVSSGDEVSDAMDRYDHNERTMYAFRSPVGYPNHS
jgi:hypothetical protein